MITRAYKHVFFDLDHTLWDFETNATRTIHQIHREFRDLLPAHVGPRDFAQRFRIHNHNLWMRFQEGKIRRRDFQWKRFWLTLMDFGCADQNLSLRLHNSYADILPFQGRLIPHARQTLEYLSERYSLHLITNGLESVQTQKIRSSGIEDYFRHIICSENSMSRKPQPEIFQYAQSMTGALPEESVMIGDRYEVDIVGARRAGWDQIYSNPGRRRHGQKPTLEIRCLRELMDRL